MRPAIASLACACALVLAACSDATAPRGPVRRPSPSAAVTAMPATSSVSPLVSAMGAALCADLDGPATPGVQAVLYPCVTDATGQQWATPTVGTSGAIRVAALCLESAGASGDNGDAMRLASCTNGANQRWTSSATGELRGYTNRCISVDGASTAPRTRLVLWSCVGAANQRWVLRAADAATPPVVPQSATPSDSALVSAMTAASAASAALCADVNGPAAPGAPAVLNACVTVAAGQQWTMPTVGTSGQIRVAALCLESAGASGDNGDVMQLASCTNGANQRWTPSAAGELRGFTNRCVSVDGAGTAQGTRLVLWSCVGAANQRWSVRWRAGFYVTPDGSSAGTGAADRPWDLATALAHPSTVRAGDTIWVRGGTYRGQFTSRLTGAASAPIVLRQYPGERATVDGNLVIFGASTVFWGLEVMSSNTSRPAVIGVNVKGPGTRFVNMVVHDAGDNGFGFWAEAPDAEIYGSLIYNNGRQISTRGAAHGIYSQNREGTKRIVDNILFNQFAYGIHVYGSDAAALRGYHIEGNASFNNGLSAIGGGAPDLLVGGGSTAQDITVTSNYTFRADEGTTAVFGANGVPASVGLALTNNYLVGSTNIMNWSSLTFTGNTFAGAQTLMTLTLADGASTGSYTWRDNRYHPVIGQWAPFNLLHGAGGSAVDDLAGWQTATGLDQGSTLTRGRPTGVRVFVRPNRYERGRANVIVYNWDRAGSVSVQATNLLSAGTRYEVRAAQDFYGTPVTSGTFYGGAITIPIRAIQPPTPIGGPVAPPSTDVEFNVYVIVPVG